MVGQRLLGRDRPRVARVDAHRVEVLDRAHDDAVARGVGHHLELELLPALHRLLDEYLPDRARHEPVPDALDQLVPVGGETAALAAESKRRADHSRARGAVRQLLEGGHDHAPGNRQRCLVHGLAKRKAILSPANRPDVGADQLDLVLREHSLLGELDREVQRCLATKRG